MNEKLHKIKMIKTHPNKITAIVFMLLGLSILAFGLGIEGLVSQITFIVELFIAIKPLILPLLGLLLLGLGTRLFIDGFIENNNISSIDEKRRITELYKSKRKNLNNRGAPEQISNPYDISNKEKQINNEESVGIEQLQKENIYKDFPSYYEGIRDNLVNKSSDSDLKASILLDKGMQYAQFGIWFFMISIVAWQVFAGIAGFHQQMIYGIVSCSVLFVFIEFVSAWFLRQYRNYIDTSVYMTKIKTIMDRFMLTYLLIKETSGDYSVLHQMMKEEIKWPESYLGKHAEVGFAKEAMEALTYMAQNLKNEVKGK